MNIKEKREYEHDDHGTVQVVSVSETQVKFALSENISVRGKEIRKGAVESREQFTKKTSKS